MFFHLFQFHSGCQTVIMLFWTMKNTPFELLRLHLTLSSFPLYLDFFIYPLCLSPAFPLIWPKLLISCHTCRELANGDLYHIWHCGSKRKERKVFYILSLSSTFHFSLQRIFFGSPNRSTYCFLSISMRRSRIQCMDLNITELSVYNILLIYTINTAFLDFPW